MERTIRLYHPEQLFRLVSSGNMELRHALIKMNKYEEGYYQYLNDYRVSRRHQVFAFLRSFYLKSLFRPQSVLDIGCGMGNLVEMLRKRGIESFGVEISEYALSQIPKECQRFCYEGNLLDLPFKEKQFDLVVTVNVLEHIKADQLEQALTESARVARLGLYHEITVLEDTRTIDLDATHVTKQSNSWWKEKLKEALGRDWVVQPGVTIPAFKHGILIARSSTTRERSPSS